MSEALEKYLEQNRIFRFEGESGVRDLEQLVEVLGYGQGFMRNRAIEEFLADNQGAMEAIVEFIGEWVERNSEWEEALQGELFEEEGEDA